LTQEKLSEYHRPVDDLERRAGEYAALGDPLRLAIVEDLVRSDRSASELATRFAVPGNLLAHHLRVLEDAGLIERVPSSGDRRRRYVRARRDRLARLGVVVRDPLAPGTPIVFVCTHNSARSQLAAALWRRHTGSAARSAGTHPARRVHPGALAAARRAGLDLDTATPRPLTDADLDDAFVVTVCDRAHEELAARDGWWHWSVPDPVASGTPAAFDAALAMLDDRIAAVA
jgi:protein-tyrosine-phosphatase/DNA-binding transcriptional ArsR family regulator